jgi:hypothetical protein
MRKYWTSVSSAIMFCMSITAQAGLLQDGGFEDPLASTPWDLFGNATLETAPSTLIEGTQAVKLDGNDGDVNGVFSVAFQFVALGTDFSVGDKIILDGLMGHLSSDPLSGANNAYIEIAFSNAMTNAGTDFSNLFQSPFLDSGFATDTYFSVSTSIATIPGKVLGVDIEYIRVAAALRQNDPSDQGVAWFDNLSLRTVPEPGTIALFGLGLA